MTGADICDVVQKPSKASPRQSVHGVQLEGADCSQDLAPAVPPAQTWQVSTLPFCPASWDETSPSDTHTCRTVQCNSYNKKKKQKLFFFFFRNNILLGVF